MNNVLKIKIRAENADLLKNLLQITYNQATSQSKISHNLKL